MDFTYETQGINTYLVYKLEKTEEINDLIKGMVSNNDIKGVVPIIYTQLDADRYIKYNISAKIQLSQCLEGTVGKKRITDILRNICDIILEAEDYMLEEKDFLWDLDKIYVDVSTNDIYMICVPVINAISERESNLKQFFKNIMFNTQFDDSEDCTYVATIVNFLNGSEPFSLEKLKKVINDLFSAEKNVVVSKKVEVQRDISKVNVVQTNATPSVAKMVAEKQQSQSPFNNMNAQPNMAQPIKTPVQAVPMPNQQPPQTPVYSNQPVVVDNKKANKKEKNKKVDKKAEKKSGGLFGSKKKPVNTPTPKPAPMPVQEGFKIPGSQAPITSMSQPMPNNKVNQPMPNNQPFASIPVRQSVNTNSNVVQAQPVVAMSTPAASVVGQKADFGSTTVLNQPSNGATEVLKPVSIGSNRQTNAYLLRVSNNEKIYITKDKISIGKEKSFVDYCIENNVAISRCHANIIKNGDTYYIVDTNSTNHTYVNGTMINSNTNVQLSDETKIELADEEFIFRV